MFDNPSTSTTLWPGELNPPLGMSPSPSLGSQQTTSVAQVQSKTETETKAHILAPQPAGRCRQPWEPVAGRGTTLADEAAAVKTGSLPSQPLAAHLLLPGLQALPRGAGGAPRGGDGIAGDQPLRHTLPLRVGPGVHRALGSSTDCTA